MRQTQRILALSSQLCQSTPKLVQAWISRGLTTVLLARPMATQGPQGSNSRCQRQGAHHGLGLPHRRGSLLRREPERSQRALPGPAAASAQGSGWEGLAMASRRRQLREQERHASKQLRRKRLLRNSRMTSGTKFSIRTRSAPAAGN